MNDITPKEAIANLNSLYGLVAPDIQRSLDVAIKALERPTGDCISREALRKKLEEMANNEWNIQVGSSKGLEDAIDVVENAQAVPLPNEQVAWEQGYEAGLAQGKHDRPHGEWVKSGKGKTTFFCSECGREIDTKPFTRPDKFPFCHCGADMRPKGGTE